MSPSPTSPQPPVESYTEALEAHLSNLQTRLAATLDALDELTRNHELELEKLHDRVHTLRARCQVFKARAKDAEAERDELREGVIKLVEKVEIANDHRVLPYSRIHLPDPLGSSFYVLNSRSLTSSVTHPREEPASFQSSVRLEDDVHRDAYLSAILSGLRAELAAGKYAFSELQRISEARIATLEAQVARRDAELQAYKPCSCRSGVPSDPLSRGSRHARIRLPNDQAHKALEEATVRQRTLEVEVEGLRRKLQSAQSTASRHSRHKWERPASRMSEDTSSKHQDPSSTFHPSAPHAHLDLPIHPVIYDIDRQLVHISRQANSLQAERDNVTIEVHANRESDGGRADGREDERFKGVLLIEEECIRLRQSERSLRQQLLVAKAAASATEQSLKSLVNKLQRQVHNMRNPDTSGGYTHKERHAEEDMESLEEEVMNDVASEHTITTHIEAPLLTPPIRCSTPPAQPSATLPPSWITTDDHDTDVQLLYSRPPSAPPSLPQNPTPVQRRSAARIARIESELHQARDDVKEKDWTIDSLRKQIAALQTAVQARTTHEKG